MQQLCMQQDEKEHKFSAICLSSEEDIAHLILTFSSFQEAC